MNLLARMRDRMVASIVLLVFNANYYQVSDGSLQTTPLVPVVHSMNINLVSINKSTIERSSRLKHDLW
jgi:hypothetical protein